MDTFIILKSDVVGRNPQFSLATGQITPKNNEFTTSFRKKLSNFAAIHERHFQKIESLVDHFARKKERSKLFINSATKQPQPQFSLATGQITPKNNEFATSFRTKLSNFAAIHVRHFQKIESLVDHVARKKERSKLFINSATKQPQLPNKTNDFNGLGMENNEDNSGSSNYELEEEYEKEDAHVDHLLNSGNKNIEDREIITDEKPSTSGSSVGVNPLLKQTPSRSKTTKKKVSKDGEPWKAPNQQDPKDIIKEATSVKPKPNVRKTKSKGKKILFKLQSAELNQGLHKIFLLENPERYSRQDQWPSEPERTTLLRLVSKTPIHEETLLRIIFIGITKDIPFHKL
uniref:Uncharacterized protein n=1 Tax=Glossina austeni TaxID=7395 RepID=A0A1A9VPB8_GLOAU